MDKELLQKLVKERKTQREIASILETSQTNIRYWLKKYDLKTVPGKGIGRFLNDEEMRIRANKRNTECQRNRAIRRKLECVKRLGGKCENCGYNRNWAALEFHHKNPEEKSFKLDLSHMGHLDEATLMEEIKKCALYCSNCHREKHNPDKFMLYPTELR